MATAGDAAAPRSTFRLSGFVQEPRECNCKLVARFSTSLYESSAWRHPLEFSLAFCALLFRNSGMYFFLSFCDKYGGMSFTAAYFFVMAGLGLPTVLILTSIGQHSKRGLLCCWNFCPVVKGVGMCLLLFSAVQRAQNLVVASEGIYLATILLEGMTMGASEDFRKCQSPLLTGFCHETIVLNLTLSDCATMNFNDVMPEWGICGVIGLERAAASTLATPSNHYLWVQVGVFDAAKASESFAGPKLRTTDLLTGRMHRGFRADKSLERRLHSNLVTFVFTLSFCGLLPVLMMEKETVWTILHILSIGSSAFLLLVNFSAACSTRSGDAFVQGLKEFGSSSKNVGLMYQPAIWVDALLLALWNTGANSGELISAARQNILGQNFIGSCLGVMVLHCLLNGLNSLCVCMMQTHYRARLHHQTLTSFGFAHMLMEVHPNTLVELHRVLSILPLTCFALDELCAFVSFQFCVVQSLMELWPRLRSHQGLLYVTLFLAFTALYLPLCTQFGGAVVYDYARVTWGWNNVLLLAVQLAAFWLYLRPDGILVLFKHLGICDELQRLLFWWRICWFGYSPLLLVGSFALLVFDALRQNGWKPAFAADLVQSGQLHGLPDLQLQALAHWWIIEIVRGATVLPVLLVAAWSLCASKKAETVMPVREGQPTGALEVPSSQIRPASSARDAWDEITMDLMLLHRRR